MATLPNGSGRIDGIATTSASINAAGISLVEVAMRTCAPSPNSTDFFSSISEYPELVSPAPNNTHAISRCLRRARACKRITCPFQLVGRAGNITTGKSSGNPILSASLIIRCCVTLSGLNMVISTPL